MSTINPIVIRCAKQIYNNLKLSRQLETLSNTSTTPEISKMQQIVLLLSEAKLQEIVKRFLQMPKPNKTLGDFISQLDSELEIFSTEDEDEIDDFDNIDDSELVQFTQESFKKRERLEEAVDLSTPKKIKSEPPPSVIAIPKPPISSRPVSLPEGYLSEEKEFLKKGNVLSSPCLPPSSLEGVPWIFLFEIARFLQSYDLKWSDLPSSVFHSFLETASLDPSQLYENMVKWNHEVRLGLKVTALAFTRMDRCFDNVWSYVRRTLLQTATPALTPATPDTPSPTSYLKSHTSNSKTIHYSGVIRFKSRISQPTITLRKPKLEPSNRLFRKFGADRFLELKLAKRTTPSLIKYHSKFFLKPFMLMQRIFRFLFVKDDVVVLFATEGHGLEPISIEQVIDWHMPIAENLHMAMSKYASRMSLGYSSSVPTLQFQPEEILYVDDIYAEGATPGDDFACMTDGCGIISCSAMKRIVGAQTAEELPCAIQGRIAGAKGIWIIAPDLNFDSGNYIKIRKSQNKFKTGLRQKDNTFDPHHYTFDLVKNSICVYPSNLNTQFIQALSAGGVPTSAFVDILKEYIQRLTSVVKGDNSIKFLRDWISQTGNVMSGRWEGEENIKKGLWRDLEISESIEGDDENDSGVFTMSSNEEDLFNEGENDGSDYMKNSNKKSYFSRLNKYSGHPCSLHDTIVRMLDSGFDLSNAYIATRVTMVFRQLMQAISIKYKIEVQQSCTVTCIPDPTGILKPGQIYLQLSNRKADEKTKVRVGQILGDVIVTRNPCGLRSDIQKATAVDCPQLRMYTDVVVFSIQGKRSLASELSGGDYDGDIVFCCWDERIVKPFIPAPVQPEPDRSKEAFEKDTKTLGEEIKKHTTVEEALQQNFISVPLPDGTLGIYENWRTVLAESLPLENPDVSYLAHMCSKLVDAPKQGLRLKSTTRASDNAKYADMPYPPWFMDKKAKQRKDEGITYKDLTEVYTLQNAPCTTAMDHLYDTLVKETADFTRYSRCMFYDPDLPFKDADLTAPWQRASEIARKLNDPLLKADLQLIASHVQKNNKEYNVQVFEYDTQKQYYIDNVRNPNKSLAERQQLGEERHQFNSHFELEECFSKDFYESPPASSFQSDIFKFDLLSNGGKMIQTIKASYAYIMNASVNKYGKYCYIVAYDFLRRIKADACAKRLKENGISETLSVSAYKSMNIDRNWLRKIKESKYVEEDVGKVRVMESKDLRKKSNY